MLSLQTLQKKEKERIKCISFKENGITCLFVIFTSLFCICSLYKFGNPKHVIHANNVNQLFLRSLLQKNTLDLDM